MKISAMGIQTSIWVDNILLVLDENKQEAMRKLAQVKHLLAITGFHHQQGQVIRSASNADRILWILVEFPQMKVTIPIVKMEEWRTSTALLMGMSTASARALASLVGKIQIFSPAQPIPDSMDSRDPPPYLLLDQVSGLGHSSPNPMESERGTPPLVLEERIPTLAYPVESPGIPSDKGRRWPCRIRNRRSLGEGWIVDPIPGHPEYQLARTHDMAIPSVQVCNLPFRQTVNLQHRFNNCSSVHSQDLRSYPSPSQDNSRHFQVHGGTSDISDPASGVTRTNQVLGSPVKTSHQT
jgi:hypothetical protein